MKFSPTNYLLIILKLHLDCESISSGGKICSYDLNIRKLYHVKAVVILWRVNLFVSEQGK